MRRLRNFLCKGADTPSKVSHVGIFILKKNPRWLTRSLSPWILCRVLLVRLIIESAFLIVEEEALIVGSFRCLLFRPWDIAIVQLPG